MKKALLGTIALVFAALGMYLAAGGAGSDEHESPVQLQSVDKSATSPGANSLPSVADMLQKLEQRLEREPDDAAGWNLLGRSYEFLGRHEEAGAAFEKAAALGYQQSANAPVAEAVIRGVVRLDPALSGKVVGNETVFVFARAVSGPRMPVAVLRKPASELPFEFVLDDSAAMNPEIKLSSYGQVIVGARLTATGDAVAHEGDLEGFSALVNVGSEEAVEVTIDQSVLMQVNGPAGEG
ncbi:MAG: hypothetical protein R3F42_04895 [Pseudomonadota bacterium]